MKNTSLTRRGFIAASLATGAAVTLPLANLFGKETSQGLTIQQVIDVLLKEIPNAPFSQTVDTIKSGNAAQQVTGIVTTMFSTVSVIRRAVELKANFIIAHEPTFYNHADEVAWLEEHDVYKFKKQLLESNGITVWRMHDYIHSFRPDGVMMGVLKSLGWEKYYNPEKRNLLNIAPSTVGQIVAHAKKSLGISKMKLVGNLDQSVKSVGLIPGAIGGRAQINFMKAESPDLLMVGEIQEWETSEYFRDLNAMGSPKSLMVLGHAVSEEPGMEWLSGWLKTRFPSVGVTHLPSGDPFLWV
jgi:putative NIF3 family GTP cyclohydrolase 1 type 2